MAIQKTPTQLVEEGKKRLEDLTNRRTRAITILETERTRLEQAKAEAETIFGFSDLVQLRAERTARNIANEQKSEQFSASLDAAETQMAAVEQQLSQS